MGFCCTGLCNHSILFLLIVSTIVSTRTVSYRFGPYINKMMTPMRYVVLVLGVVVRIASFSNETAERSMYLQISLHYILSFSHEAYSRATSLSRLTESLRKPSVPPYHIPTPDEYYRNSTITPPDRKANAAFVVLARNNDLDGVLSSMKQMEDRFNKKFNYPWIFLNEQPFTEEFKK